MPPRPAPTTTADFVFPADDPSIFRRVGRGPGTAIHRFRLRSGSSGCCWGVSTAWYDCAAAPNRVPVNSGSFLHMPLESSDITGILAAQREFFAAGGTRPLPARLAPLRRLAESLATHTDSLLEALRADLGKPPVEAWLAEVQFVRDEIRLVNKQLARWARPRRVGNPFYFLPARSEVRREPFGSVLVAGPWNYPLQLALSPLVGAVAAGNCVVLKPSELAPATAARLADILRDIFDPAHVAVVTGGPETGAQLLEQRFDFFFYTGGGRIGRRYAEAAARHLAPCTLELGGKCPAILDDGIDLPSAAERLVTGKFFNAGQTCVAPDFVLVPSSAHDGLIEALQSELDARYASPSPSPDLARIVNEAHFDRLVGLVSPDALATGDDDRPGRYLAPRLLPGADWEMPAMQEEIFGPILPVIPYAHLSTALDELARRPAPLAVYPFSKRPEFVRAVTGAVASGSVCVNDTMKPATNPQLPLGGVGASGMGRYHGRAGFENFTYPRAVVRRWLGKDPFLLKPPYDGQLERLRKMLGR